MKRLYYQVYLTIVASLMLVVLVGVGLWYFVDDSRHIDSRHISELAREFAAAKLAPIGAIQSEQRVALVTLSERLRTDLTLYGADRRRIAVAGEPLPLPRQGYRRGWHRGPRGRATWLLELPDKRLLVALVTRPRFSEFGVAAFLGGIVLAVALAALPLARRVTRRVERLQRSVELLGAGDLTARVKVEGRDEVARLAESFNRAAERIAELVASHKMLLANASHELRTPLARIRMGVELLKQQADPERKAALDRDIAELDRLIEEILMTSRLDAGAELDTLEDVDILALAAEESARYQDCEVAGAAVVVRGDPRLLRHLVRNLLDNADRHGAPPIEVTVTRNDGGAMVRVCDAGPGVAAAEVESVFEPFRRTASSDGSRSGSGLGLTLVRQIARRHGGEAIYRSDTQTSCFEITLPTSGPTSQS